MVNRNCATGRGLASEYGARTFSTENNQMGRGAYHRARPAGAMEPNFPWLPRQEQRMHIEALHAPKRSTLIRAVTTALLLTLAACSQMSDSRKAAPDKNAPRAQLYIGYSLLYQEADGIPRLKWIL